MPEVDAEEGGYASSDEPIPLRRTVHSCHEWIDNHLGWIHQGRRQPMQQLRCTGVNPTSLGFGDAPSSKTFF